MKSELDLLNERGLPIAPDHTKPSPPGADAAWNDFHTFGKDFEQLFTTIRGYVDRSITAAEALGVYQILDRAVRLAGDLREKALALSRYPNTFHRIGSQAVYFGEVAGAAEEAYRTRMEAMTVLERLLGKTVHPHVRVVEGTLLSHEGFKGGHLLRKHVGWTMEQFQGRFIEDGKEVLSSFIDRATAEESVSRAIELHKAQIAQAQDGERIKVRIEEIREIGYVKERGKSVRFTKVGYVYIFKDSSHPSGYRITSAELGDV